MLFSHAGHVLSWCHLCPCFQLGSALQQTGSSLHCFFSVLSANVFYVALLWRQISLGQALSIVETGGITHCSVCRLSAAFGLGGSALSAVQLHSKQLDLPSDPSPE